MRSYGLSEMVGILEAEKLDEELYILFDNNVSDENPFPYPFKSENIGVLLFLKGKVKIQINMITYLIEENDLVIFSPECIVHVLKIIEEHQAIGITFSKEFGQKMTGNHSELNILRFFAFRESPICRITEHKKSIFFHLIHNMHQLVTEKYSPYINEQIYHYFNLLALETLIARESTKDLDLGTLRKKKHISVFLNLLAVHCKEQRSVQFYAEKLAVTPGYLSSIAKETTAMTARQLIEEVVIAESINLLKDNTYSIAQISEKLNFSNQSFFGKFFKNNMKVSPKAFREKYK